MLNFLSVQKLDQRLVHFPGNLDKVRSCSVNLDDPNFDQPSISYAHNPRFSSIFHTSSLAEAATWTACSGRFSAIERDPWTADLGHEDTIRGGVTGLQAVTISDHQ